MVPNDTRRLDRHGVLLLRGRRALDHGRRRPRRDGHPGDRAARPGPGRRRSSSASSSASTRPIRSTTPSTPSAWPRSARWLDGDRRTCIQVGRNGLHRYNNSDHSMLTAMRAVDNILLGTHHDIWAVNAESVYHEEDVEPNSHTGTRPRRRRWSSRSRRSGSAGVRRACCCGSGGLGTCSCDPGWALAASSRHDQHSEPARTRSAPASHRTPAQVPTTTAPATVATTATSSGSSSGLSGSRAA